MGQWFRISCSRSCCFFCFFFFFLKIYYVLLLVAGYLGIPFNSPYQFLKFLVEGVLRINFCDIIGATDSESCLNM